MVFNKNITTNILNQEFDRHVIKNYFNKVIKSIFLAAISFAVNYKAERRLVAALTFKPQLLKEYSQKDL